MFTSFYHVRYIVYVHNCLFILLLSSCAALLSTEAEIEEIKNEQILKFGNVEQK